jgi:transcriptional regulator GlxA family with amidase domain
LPTQSLSKTHGYQVPETTLAVAFLSQQAGRNIAGRTIDYRVQRAVLDIRKSILITTKQLADSANLSIDHFSRLFKKETGMSPHQYLKEVRLSVARAFLESSELSVKELSTRSGFKDQSHFVRDFKKAYGLSPMQYRIECRKSDSDSTTETANK